MPRSDLSRNTKMEPGELQPAGWEPSLVDRSLRWALLSLELLPISLELLPQGVI